MYMQNRLSISNLKGYKPVQDFSVMIVLKSKIAYSAYTNRQTAQKPILS